MDGRRIRTGRIEIGSSFRRQAEAKQEKGWKSLDESDIFVSQQFRFIWFHPSLPAHFATGPSTTTQPDNDSRCDVCCFRSGNGDSPSEEGEPEEEKEEEEEEKEEATPANDCREQHNGWHFG